MFGETQTTQDGAVKEELVAVQKLSAEKATETVPEPVPVSFEIV